MSNDSFTLSSTATKPYYNGMIDLQDFSGTFSPEERGAALDVRMATRTSMPPLFSPARQQQEGANVPDLNQLIQRAHSYKCSGNTALYEACMDQMVGFFVNGKAGSGRTPLQVAKAFSLPLHAGIAEQVMNEMPFLNQDQVRNVCKLDAKIDIDQFDVLIEAEKQRK